MRIDGDWIGREATQRVCRMLSEAGHQALFVGGCVRDALLDHPVRDIDIATDALPIRVVDLAEARGLRAVPTGIDHGTVTVVSDGIPHEVTTFRKDVQTDGRRATVAFSTDIAEDAQRRDFTMNALYAGPDGAVIDPLGGLPDLLARKVRFIQDADQRIREDYLRILRFFRFHAWYGDPGNGLDPDGLAACAALSDGLESLSRERVGAEMRKLLAAPDPAPALAAMRISGVLARVLPGADDTAIAPLVHLEAASGIAPEAVRRLAALGGERVEERLRLSRADAKRRSSLLDGVGSAASAAELGYRHGYETGRDILLLRAAVQGGPLSADSLSDLKLGARAVFPVTARDLMPELEGPALGQRLKDLEQRWIASRFTLTREALLG